MSKNENSPTFGTLQFLGTGASAGVPIIGCSCATCTSKNEKNQRFRTSAIINVNGSSILIDAGPDLRMQALNYGIKRVDALLISHSHYDHIGGLEELRIFNFYQKAPISCVVSDETLSDLKQLFYYLFSNRVESKNSKFDFIELKNPSGEFTICNIPIRYYTYYQKSMKVLGYRFGDLAYITDIKDYDEGIFEFLSGVSTLVISALKFTPSALHLSIDEAVDFVEKVSPKRSYFIHISHDIEYEHASCLLPQGIELAYDGLKIPLYY